VRYRYSGIPNKRGSIIAALHHAATSIPVNPAFSTGDGHFGLLVTAAPAV
jgi:hypothetical protein